MKSFVPDGVETMSLNQGSAKILVIDDERAVRDSTRKYLQAYSYDIVEAENGEMGLELFIQEKPGSNGSDSPAVTRDTHYRYFRHRPCLRRDRGPPQRGL